MEDRYRIINYSAAVLFQEISSDNGMEKKLDMQCDLSLLLASNLETCTYVYKHIQARKKDIRFYMKPPIQYFIGK